MGQTIKGFFFFVFEAYKGFSGCRFVDKTLNFILSGMAALQYFDFECLICQHNCIVKVLLGVIHQIDKVFIEKMSQNLLKKKKSMGL